MGYDLLKNYIPIHSYKKCRDNEDFLIVMNFEGDIYYLNETAKYIFLNFDGKKTIKDIFENMKNKYDANNEDELILKKDLTEIIRDFQWQNIINLMEV